MTLYEYMNLCEDGMEITVWDADYDMETYFYAGQGADIWGEAMNDIAKCLTLLKISDRGVTVNLYEVIDNNIEALDEADIFINCDTESIMDDIDNIFAGNVSEGWLRKFADVLLKGDK